MAANDYIIKNDTGVQIQGSAYRFVSGSVNILQYDNKKYDINTDTTVSGSLTVIDSLVATGSFVLPLSSSVSPVLGSAYWSGSFLFVYNGTKYVSASFA